MSLKTTPDIAYYRAQSDLRERIARGNPVIQNKSRMEFGMSYWKRFEEEVSGWPSIQTHSHRFGGREFRLGSAEVGHVHTGGTVDIPLPRAIHDVLLAQGLAEQHRWVPDSGWITFHMSSEEDLGHALWLMRLSYLRYALKSVPDAHELLERESRELHLSPQLRSLLEQFVPRERVAS
jgi:Family of unknown function (DUF5519)